MLSESFMSWVLLVMVLLPLVGAGLVMALAEHGIGVVRRTALLSVLATFALSVLVVSAYDPQKTADGAPKLLQMRSEITWLGTPKTLTMADNRTSTRTYGPDIQFSLGVDGISLWLIALTALLMIPSVLVSWEAIQERPAAFYSLMLVLESGMLGVFAAQDIILFYIFFEFTLIPLFFMIGIWGGYDRRWAARKFFIYTLAGSLLTFLGLLFIVLSHSWMYFATHHTYMMTFSIPQLLQDIPQFVADHAGPNYKFWQIYSPWIFAALFIGFAIKVPLFPFHTWLPLAHVEAPTAGSVLLAGVLLKLGSYGFLRFMLPLVPGACWLAMDFIAVLAVVGIIYGALLALAQDDIKKLVAYSSVSHMGFCLLGLFALNSVGISGGLLQMINHGLSTGALFAMVGMVYERYHTRDIEAFGGLTRKFPVLAFFFVLVVLSSIGLPGLNGFTGELLSLMGMFEIKPAYAVLGLSGIIIGAWYMLGLVKQIMYGSLKEPATEGHPGSSNQITASTTAQGDGRHDHHAAPERAHARSDSGHGPNHRISDLNFRELAALVPITVVIVWIGVYPQFFLSRMEPSITDVVRVLNQEKPGARAMTAASIPRSSASPLSASALPAAQEKPDRSLRTSLVGDAPRSRNEISLDSPAIAKD